MKHGGLRRNNDVGIQPGFMRNYWGLGWDNDGLIETMEQKLSNEKWKVN